MIRWIIYWLDSLIMMLWLEILGGRAHLSLQDLVGGQFWENKPSLGFHGATSPQVGCQGPACQIRERWFGRPWWWLEWPSPPISCQTIFPRGVKCPTFEHDVMILRARDWWWGATHFHLNVVRRRGSSPWWDHLDAWHMALGGPSMLLQHQRPPQSGKTSPKGMVSS